MTGRSVVFAERCFSDTRICHNALFSGLRGAGPRTMYTWWTYWTPYRAHWTLCRTYCTSLPDILDMVPDMYWTLTGHCAGHTGHTGHTGHRAGHDARHAVGHRLRSLTTDVHSPRCLSLAVRVTAAHAGFSVRLRTETVWYFALGTSRSSHQARLDIFTRYNLLSYRLSNPFDNRFVKPVVQPGLITG